MSEETDDKPSPFDRIVTIDRKRLRHVFLSIAGGGDRFREEMDELYRRVAHVHRNVAENRGVAELLSWFGVALVPALGGPESRGLIGVIAPDPRVIAEHARAQMDRLASDDPGLASEWGDIEQAACALVRREVTTADAAAAIARLTWQRGRLEHALRYHEGDAEYGMMLSEAEQREAGMGDVCSCERPGCVEERAEAAKAAR